MVVSPKLKHGQVITQNKNPWFIQKIFENAYAVEVLMNFPFLDIIGQCSSLKPTEAVNKL